MVSGPLDPAFDGDTVRQVLLVDGQLVTGARARRTAFPLANGLARKGLHARLGPALHAREEPVGARVAQRTHVPEGDARHGPHVAARGRTVALEHLVERLL